MGDGILVDEHLQTSSPGIFAAGDVANFHHSALGMRVRVEHEDNALKMGQAAGCNMAGADPTRMCPCSTRISSTWGTKPSGS